MSLKKDIIGAEVQLGSNQAQKALVDLEQKTSSLKNANDRLRISQQALKAEGKQNTEEYKNLTKEISKNSKEIRDNASQMNALRKTLGLTDMTSKQLKQRISQLRSELSGMTEKADPERWAKLNSELEATQKQFTNVQSKIGHTSNFMSELGSSLSSIPGPVGQVIQGITGVGKALWALVANPIGAVIAAIVAGLTLLYKAFISTDTGATTLASTFKAIKNVVDVLIDRVVSFTKMLGSLITFDWSGVKKNAIETFEGIGTAIKDAANAGWDYEQTMDSIKDREAAAANRMTRLRVEIENLTNASKDQTKSNKERMDAAQQAMDKEIELNGIEKKFLQERNNAEIKNLASKIQNSKISLSQKEEELNKWLMVDDLELTSMLEKDAAFRDFYDKNEDDFQSLQKAKAEELAKEAELAQSTRRLQSQLSGFKKGLIEEEKKSAEKEQKEKIEKLQASYNEEKALINKNHLEGKTSEDQYNADLLLAELKFYKDKLSIYKAGSKEYEQAVNDALQKQVEADKKIKDLLLQAEKELANAKISNLEEGLQKQEAAETQRWINEKAALEKRLVDKQVLSDQEIALNNTINQLIEEGEAAHQKKMQDLKDAQNIQDLQDMVTATTPVDPNFATPEQQQAQYDARTALIQAQYDREKALAGDNQAALMAAEQRYNQQMYQLKSDQIDAEYALTEKRIGAAQQYVSMLSSVVDEESGLGKALFLFNQALAIGEVWVNIAKANAKAIAASPLTLGQPWVTANTIMGGVQTALIAAQTVAKFTKKKGKKEGGYTDKASDDNQVVDYVHSNEFVANALSVRNPTIKPVLDIINIAQKQGKAATLNLPAVLGAIGRRSGGYDTTHRDFEPISSQISSVMNRLDNFNKDSSNQDYSELLKAINRLNKNLEGGISAKLYYRDLEEYEDKVTTIRETASL
ncbi:MAG: hypothetical protein AB2L24_21895 [Mangrovibacterium sp.]